MSVEVTIMSKASSVRYRARKSSRAAAACVRLVSSAALSACNASASLALAASKISVRASMTVGTPMEMTRQPSVASLISRRRFPIPAPGAIPVSSERSC